MLPSSKSKKAGEMEGYWQQTRGKSDIVLLFNGAVEGSIVERKWQNGQRKRKLISFDF
jgi:hypothetical protein